LIKLDSNAYQLILNIDKWQLIAVVLKSLTYASVLSAAGGIFFLSLFSSQLLDTEKSNLKSHITLMAYVGFISSIIRICNLNIILSGDLFMIFNPTFTKIILDSKEGFSTELRMTAMLIILLVGIIPLNNLSKMILIFGAILSAVSFALVGHSSEITSNTWPPILAEALLSLHLITVSFWIGSLLPLHRLTYSNDLTRVAKIMHRFGQVAILVVAILVILGLILVGLILNNCEMLLFSGYGKLVLLKLLFVTILISIAAKNKLKLTPLLLSGNQMANFKIRQQIKFEIVLVALILLVTASFTVLVGPP